MWKIEDIVQSAKYLVPRFLEEFMIPYIRRKQGSTYAKGEQMQTLRESLTNQIFKNVLSQKY